MLLEKDLPGIESNIFYYLVFQHYFRIKNQICCLIFLKNQNKKALIISRR